MVSLLLVYDVAMVVADVGCVDGVIVVVVIAAVVCVDVVVVNSVCC